jgi:hypothetical protein
MFELALVMLRPMYLGAVLFLFTFFVLGPAIASGIAYAAWKGKPKNFDREMYWTAFAAAILASGFLMVFAQRMQADVRTWKYVAQIACFGIGAVLFGVAGGCLLGVFIYRRGVRSSDPTD